MYRAEQDHCKRHTKILLVLLPWGGGICPLCKEELEIKRQANAFLASKPLASFDAKVQYSKIMIKGVRNENRVQV